MAFGTFMIPDLSGAFYQKQLACASPGTACADKAHGITRPPILSISLDVGTARLLDAADKEALRCGFSSTVEGQFTETNCLTYAPRPCRSQYRAALHKGQLSAARRCSGS